MITPEPLRLGSRVALVGASGPVHDGSEWQKIVQGVSALGLEAHIYPSATSRCGYLAGTDEVRAGDINRAFADPAIEGILCVRGGYGAMRILPMLDWAQISRSPKFFLGYSDVTALHIAFNQHCGFVTYHAPMPLAWASGLDEYTDGWLRSVLFGRPRSEYKNPPGVPPMRALVPGRAEGELCGGNLSLIASSLGTPWEIDTRGRVLFIEEVSEEPYRIDRSLTQLRNAGKLDTCAGIVLGGFTNCEAEEPTRSLTLEQVFADILIPARKPTLAGLMCGHCAPTLSLPLGAHFVLDADNCLLKEKQAH